ncbi:titin homolog [Hetaerina americana]|uniref:titin homolog n=1 Tax=Hetaerina americana TaxID=62018 RepID=UPI003A7F3D87
MKEEEPQVTLRRSNSRGAGSPGLDSPFQRAPRPNSQPPGSSESAQVRRSVREIRKSFEASTSADLTETPCQPKPTSSVRRSFHFERGSSIWETSGNSKRKQSSNGEGASSFSPVNELELREDRDKETTGSRIPIREREGKVQFLEKEENVERKKGKERHGRTTNSGVQKMCQREKDAEKGNTLLSQVSNSSSSSGAGIVAEVEFPRLVCGEDVEVAGALIKNEAGRETIGCSSSEIKFSSSAGQRKKPDDHYQLNLGADINESNSSGNISNPNECDKDFTLGDGKDNKTIKTASEVSRSPIKANGLATGDSECLSDTSTIQKDSLSVIEAAESLEKSKSQIDRLQSNLLPLSCETVNSLQSKFQSSKSPVLKAMPIPKSTSAPATMASCYNGTNKSLEMSITKGTDQPEVLQEREALQSSIPAKDDGGRKAQGELDLGRWKPVDPLMKTDDEEVAAICDKNYSTEISTDSKSKLRAQFFETDVKSKTEKMREKDKTVDDKFAPSLINKADSQEEQTQGATALVSANKPSTENSTRKATPPKDLPLTAASSVTYAPKPCPTDSETLKQIENGREKISTWLNEETISVESTQKTYRMLDKSITVASYKQNGNAQQDLQNEASTAPRVVGVETKKGIEVPGMMLMHSSSQWQAGIPVPAERKKVPESTNIKCDRAPSPHIPIMDDKGTTSEGVSSPAGEEYRAFLLCARREELFANEMDIAGTLPDNGMSRRLEVAPKKVLPQKDQQDFAGEPEIKANRKEDSESKVDETGREESAKHEGTKCGVKDEIDTSIELGSNDLHDHITGDRDDRVDTKEDEGHYGNTKESPKGVDKGSGKKIGFMMAVLGGLKDSNKKKKSPPKENPDQPKPKREVKKRRGRVGPPLTEEEIKELEEEAERKRKAAEERRAQEAKSERETKANAVFQNMSGKDQESPGKSPASNDLVDQEGNLLNLDEDDRSAVRRDAYADLLKKLVKAEARKDTAGGGDDKHLKIVEQDEDTDGSDTAVEEGEDGEYDYEDAVELRKFPGRRGNQEVDTDSDRAKSIKGKPPVAPVPSVRTTSLTSRSISKTGPKSPTIMVETVSPTLTAPPTPSPSVLSPGGSRTGSESDVSGPRKRTIIETAFIGSDTISSTNCTSNVDERQTASARLLRTPSPQITSGQSRIPHTSLVLEEKLRRRSSSAERDPRRAVSLSPTPIDSSVNRSRGGGNSRHSGDDLTDGEIHSPEGIFDHVDKHRPLKQCLNPPEEEKKMPAKTFLQRLLRQSTPPPVEKQGPHSHRSGSPRRQNPPRACMAYANTSTKKQPLFAQSRDPRVASLPPGVPPPGGSLAELRVRSLSPPTTPSEYQAMRQYYQRQSPEYASSSTSVGVGRVQSPPPVLTNDRANLAVRPQPVHRNAMGMDSNYGSAQSMPGRIQDPRSRSLSPQNAAIVQGGRENFFVRGAPARTTIAAGERIPGRKGLSSERAGSTSTLPVPIFKRGTITASSEDSVCSAPAAPKRVSFSNSTPTKAEREHMRMLQLREWQQRAMSTGQGQGFLYGDDDVFTDVAPNKPLPPTPSLEEMEEEKRWLKGAMAVGGRTPMKYLEVSPTGVSESESGSEAGEVRRIMRRRHQGKVLGPSRISSHVMHMLSVWGTRES